MRRSQNGQRATQSRSASGGSSASSVSSAMRRFADSRSSRGSGDRARQEQRPLGVAPGEHGRLAGLLEPFARTGERLEQPVAPVAAEAVDRDERLLDEAAEDVGDVLRFEAVARADLLDRVELEAAREDGEAAQQHPLVRLEQVVAPLRASPRGSAAASAPRGCRRAGGGSGRRAAPRSRPRRAPPSGRRRARARAAGRRGGSRSGRRRPRSPRRGRTPGRRPRRARRRAAPPRTRAAPPGSARSGSGIPSEGTRKTTSPGMRSGSRLVATIVSPDAARSSASASAALAPRTCSQLSRTRSSERARGTRDRVERGSARAAPGRRAPRRRRRGRARLADRRELDERRAVLVRALDRRASSRASRVLPAPPPVSVSSRVRRGAPQLGELALAADERGRLDRKPAAGSRRRRAPRAPRRARRRSSPSSSRRLRPVLVPVLGQELAAVQRQGGAVCGRRADAACVGDGALELLDVDVRVSQSSSSRSSSASAPRVRRATCTAWCRLFEAASGPLSRQKRPSPARGAAGGPARARAASRARGPSAAAMRPGRSPRRPRVRRSRPAARSSPLPPWLKHDGRSCVPPLSLRAGKGLAKTSFLRCGEYDPKEAS